MALALTVVVGLEILCPTASRASIMVGLDMPTMVKQADHIAVVEVASVQAAWDEHHERIYSTIELNVVESMKGSAGDGSAPGGHLTVVQAGGTVGDIRMTVIGMGSFVPGERSLVFLRGPANRAQVVGMTQGKRNMRYESSSRSWLVAPPDLRQAKLVRAPLKVGAADRQTLKDVVATAPPQSTPAATTRPTTPARDQSLDDIRVEIKRLLAAVGR